MKKIYFFLIFLSISVYSLAGEIRNFDILCANGAKIKATLHYPESKMEKIVVEINKIFDTPIVDGSDSTTLCRKLDRGLNKYNVGWVEYKIEDPQKRTMIEVVNSIPKDSLKKITLVGFFKKLSDSPTLFDYANYATSIVTFLKNEKEYANCKIGVFGISELGCSALVVGTQNRKVDFVLSITIPLVAEPEIYIANVINPFNRPAKMSLGYISMGFQSMLKQQFTFKGHTYINSDKQYEKCFIATLDSINHRIFKIENPDSIHDAVFGVIHGLWKMEDFKSVDAKIYGEILSPKDYFENIFYRLIYNPSEVAIIKFDPNQYLSKISIPTFIAVADKDQLIPYKPNNIVSNKQIQVHTFMNHYHGLAVAYKPTKPTTASKGDDGLKFLQTPDSTANVLIKWIMKI